MGIYAMTGGATGIGAAIKQRLREEGNQVIVVDIRMPISLPTCRAGREGSGSYGGPGRRCRWPGRADHLRWSGSNVPNCPLITQVNYFGTVEIIAGLATPWRPNAVPSS